MRIQHKNVCIVQWCTDSSLLIDICRYATKTANIEATSDLNKNTCIVKKIYKVVKKSGTLKSLTVFSLVCLSRLLALSNLCSRFKSTSGGGLFLQSNQYSRLKDANSDRLTTNPLQHSCRIYQFNFKFWRHVSLILITNCSGMQRHDLHCWICEHKFLSVHLQSVHHKFWQ